MTAGAGRPAPFDLDLLRAEPGLAAWLHVLEQVPEADDLDLPAGPDLVDALLALAVPHEDVAGALAARPRPGTDAEWLVRRTASVLLAGLGDLDTHPVPPAYPHLHDDLRWLPLLAVVAAAPATRRWWAGRGVGDDVVRATLADVGRHMTHTRRRHGHGGLCVNTDWLALHVRGRIVQLGRLQWERYRLGRTNSADIAGDGFPVGPGDLGVGVHVPDYCGPFTPQDCDASTARAVRFHAEHLPGDDLRVATCHSWLLDPALDDLLAPTSNTAAFRRRFRVVPRTVTDDQAVVEFVFGRRLDDPADLDALPRRTSLERAVGDHLRAGRHWHGGLGWFAWPPT